MGFSVITLIKKKKNLFSFLLTLGLRRVQRLVRISNKKNVDSFRNAVLSLTYYFKSQETFARIDSLPTQQLKDRNKKALDKIYQESKKSNGSLCGRGLQEIKTKDYPKKLRTITNEEFKKLIPSYTQQPKMK